MLEHVLMSRLNDMSEGRLETGMLTVSAGSIDYEGVNLKGRHVVIVCDLVDEDSDYLKECINLCKEMKASHVVAVPLMLWNPELIDNLTEETIKAELSHEIVLSPSKTKTITTVGNDGAVHSAVQDGQFQPHITQDICKTCAVP